MHILIDKEYVLCYTCLISKLLMNTLLRSTPMEDMIKLADAKSNYRRVLGLRNNFIQKHWFAFNGMGELSKDDRKYYNELQATVEYVAAELKALKQK